MQTGLVERFATLLRRGEPFPDVFAFLDGQGRPAADEQLVVVLQDQQYRWTTGHPLLVEDYLARLPDLATDRDSRIQLVLGEFFARRGQGLPAHVADFEERFGDIGDSIREHLSSLGAGEATLQRSTLAGWSSRSESVAVAPALADPMPLEGFTIGRYKLVRSLGEGAFGQVFLSLDEELDRRVAIKVPSPERYRESGDAEAFLIEARMVARLDHPHIVPVHDVGRSAGGEIFVVSKLIEGRTLRDLIREGRPGPAAAATLLGTVARALHHAHQRGLIHRDVKPSNILIEDETGTPFVADFGLAVREEDHPRASTIAGTPSYMSPEQARGEGHRLDARSDIFSLGAILYEVLTGRKPFQGWGPREVLREVIAVDPPPPREIDPEIPAELERICLKALAKRASDRYPTMQDLADDLDRWPHDPEPVRQGPPIIPRGLRAFGADDAHFFPDLLPGPRDRRGLPEAIRFWKQRVEEDDLEKTFSVGLLYGPSGCGKSSLVRAGLLPRLHPGIVAVCVDASPADTAVRILGALRKRLPRLPADQDLVATFASLRRGVGSKVLVVLDQFEQWLHAHGEVQGSELVDALRQCDGEHLQAILLIRDDFAMAAARFMDALDVPIVQGNNFATLDLFDVDHARLVLTRLGQAFGRLPTGLAGPSVEQRRFLDHVARALAREGRVVSVQLALFAEMVKGRPWVPATLDEAGGTEGIGVTFLEETFSSRSANPTHRRHEAAARGVLKALLPPVGSVIKGNLRSSAEIREASGLTDRPAEFASLLRVLDGELRLLTPTAPPGASADQNGDPDARYWQLTHDYLVPSLRAWLTRKQKETRRGRAELRLEERAASWSARRERQQLPSLREWLGIRILTAPSRWTAPERALMLSAGRRHGCRLVVAAALLAGAALVGERAVREARTAALIDQLFVADVGELPRLAGELTRPPARGVARLDAIARDPDATPRTRRRAAYVLAGQIDRARDLIELAADADPPELAAIRERLVPHRAALAGDLWGAARCESAFPAEQLRYAALLAGCDEDRGRWDALAGAVAPALLGLEQPDIDILTDLLRPAAPSLSPHLVERFYDASALAAERTNAARVLARLADGPLLVDLLLNADPPQFAQLFPATDRHREAVVEAAHRAIDRWTAIPPDADRRVDAGRARNAAFLLLRLGDPDPVEGLMGLTPDPTVRMLVILKVLDYGVAPDLLLGLLDRWQAPAARQALLLALEPYRDRQWSKRTRQAFTTHLAKLVRDGRDQAERGAAEWVLRRLVPDAPLEEAVGPRGAPGPPAGRDWYLTSQGHTMVVLDLPASPGHLAVGTHEVSVRQYLRFKPDARFQFQADEHKTEVPDPLWAAAKVSFLDAMRYCRWLSEEEGIPEDQMCYPPIAQIKPGDATLSEERRGRTGYRLPTTTEWGLAADAGAHRSSYSIAQEYLDHFAWYGSNSGLHVHRVGTLRPNPFGLFDVLGNVSEWCHPAAPAGASGAPRGGSYQVSVSSLRAYGSDAIDPNAGYSFLGLRVVRTISPGQSSGE